MRTRLTQIIATLIFTLVPAGLSAQQPGELDPTQLPAEARELITELQEIQSKLQPIEQQALQDPGLQTAQQALGEQIQQAMVDADPATPQHVARLESLMGEAREAQAGQDQQKMSEIVAEAHQIEERLQAAQTQALQRPEIQPKVEEFQTRLQEKMQEVDPNAESLIERAQELGARLAMVLGQDQ